MLVSSCWQLYHSAKQRKDTATHEKLEVGPVPHGCGSG